MLIHAYAYMRKTTDDLLTEMFLCPSVFGSLALMLSLQPARIFPYYIYTYILLIHPHTLHVG